MNLERIKILKNIVNDLRSRNELDEDKWKAYKESRDLRNISFAAITFIAASLSWFADSIFVFGLVIILCIFFWWRAINTLIDQYILYTIGKRTIANVIEASFERISAEWINKYTYKYEFADINNIKYVVECMQNLSKNTRESRPPVGDRIEIIYLESNPRVATRYVENQAQKFILRKN